MVAPIMWSGVPLGAAAHIGDKGPHAHFSQCVRAEAAAVRGFRGFHPVSAPLHLLAGPLQQSRWEGTR